MPSTSVDEETEDTPPGNTADVDEKTTAEHEAVEGEEAERDSEVLWGAVGDSDVGPGIDEECFVASIEHASHPFALVKTSVVALSGLIVAATIRFLTGRGKDGGGKSDSRQRVEPAEEEDHEEKTLSSGPIISESENVAYGGMIRELGELKADNLILSAKCEDLEEELLEMTGVLDAANGEIQELKKQIMDLVEED